MITGKQIASARMLLGWSQEDLAYKSGLTRSAIQKIERQEVTQPRITTMNKILEALQKANIEFIENGVRIKSDIIKVLDGEDFYIKLLDEVYYTLKDIPDSELLYGFVDNSLSTQAVITAENRLREAGIKFRHIVRQGNECLNYPLNEYRYFPARNYENYNVLVFGERVGLVIDRNTKAMVIHDPSLANVMTNMFDYIWSSTVAPQKSIARTSGR